MEEIRAHATPDPRVPLTCFVTAAEPREEGPRRGERFFADMYRLTSGDASRPASADVEACQQLLARVVADRPELTIRSPVSALPSALTLELNDGVVNTARQIADPDDPAQIGGFVVADHADVLGHYDRQDSLIPGRPYNAGLFHSGAGFGDDQFFLLYQRVVHAIVKRIEAKAHPATAS